MEVLNLCPLPFLSLSDWLTCKQCTRENGKLIRLRLFLVSLINTGQRPEMTPLSIQAFGRTRSKRWSRLFMSNKNLHLMKRQVQKKIWNSTAECISVCALQAYPWSLTIYSVSKPIGPPRRNSCLGAVTQYYARAWSRVYSDLQMMQRYFLSLFQATLCCLLNLIICLSFCTRRLHQEDRRTGCSRWQPNPSDCPKKSGTLSTATALLTCQTIPKPLHVSSQKTRLGMSLAKKIMWMIDEVDGYGSRLIMDDANVPSLLSLSMIGFVAQDDPIYQRTRQIVLSKANPYYFSGPRASGIGGPHVDVNYAWPMSQIVRVSN